jgi:surface carbohydrate biosynthesis protein
MNDRPRRVGLIVDHPKRDLAGLVLLARALAERGIDSFLIPQYEQAVDVPLLGLDALVVNYARPANREIVADFARSGIAVYVLDTEGGVLAKDGPNAPHKLAAYIAESGFGALLAGYFFWGPVLRDAFAAGAALPPDRLHLTGCPRFDVAAPGMRTRTPPRRTGHILINTNFSMVNARFGGRGGDDRPAMAAFGYGADQVERLAEDVRAIMRGMIDTVRRLSREFPGQQFVLRPHPFEGDSVYREAFADYPNIVVDGSGDVFDALNGARALLQVNCGTAIDAIMLGVPPLSLDFLNTDYMRNHASLLGGTSINVADYEALAAMIGGELPPFDAAARYAEFAEPWFYRNDGQATERVADVLAADLAGTSGPPRSASIRRSLAASRAQPSLGQRAQSLLANLAGSLASSRLRMLAQRHRRDKTFGPAAVRGLLALPGGGGAPPGVARARHPVTKAPLASLAIRARGPA